jgi:hypothetical protein
MTEPQANMRLRFEPAEADPYARATAIIMDERQRRGEADKLHVPGQ